jgi:hypothetical protein
MNENQETQLLSPEDIAEVLLRNKEVRRDTDRQTIIGLSIVLGRELSNSILRECQVEFEKRSGHDNN